VVGRRSRIGYGDSLAADGKLGDQGELLKVGYEDACG
jgi:hypothetical protein